MQGYRRTLPLLFAGLLSGCTQQINARAYEDYLALAPAGSFSDPATDARLQPFLNMFATLSSEDVNNWIDQVYAESVYFNDTFHTYTERDQIKRYFLNLADKSRTEVRVLDFSANEDDYFLRWRMRTRFDVFWRELDIETVGLTHLRFNEEGLIVLHQDYWDGVEGFYSHLPVIGGSLKRIRSGLGEG